MKADGMGESRYDAATLQAWVEARATRDVATGCLTWKAGISTTGKEPQGRYLGQIVLVRRALLEAKRGERVKRDRTVKPSCCNELCVEYTHLVSKARKKGREGQRNTLSHRINIAKAARARGKLTLEAVEDIRSMTEPREVYAQRYNIAKEYVTDLQGYRAWKDYQNPFMALLAA